MNPLNYPVALLSAFGASLALAEVTTSPTMPSGTGVLATSTNFGTTLSRIFDIDANANHARGNRFLLGNSGGTTFRIDSVTIQASGGQVFVDDIFTLFIYQGTSAEWNTGTGRLAENPDFYTGTTVTPLTSESFTVNQTIANGSYVTFELTTPIIVAENADYGFFVTYEQVGGALTNFAYQESGSPTDVNDGRTSITDTSHGTTTGRQMDYWIQGEAIDPGITDSTLTLSDTLISTGNAIDIEITFDPTVDTAELTTVPATATIDLKALDDGTTNGDLAAGDGIVSLVSDVLTSSVTYEVGVTKVGQTSETVSVAVTVVDPAAVPDTTLSSAILADGPVFYYRYEEPVDAGYLIDYSGNDFHADDLVGTLVQGTSSSGVGSAIEMTGDGGIRTPVARNMNLPFTFTTIVDLDEFPSSTLRNILSMSDGGGGRVGRSILHTRGNGLGTEISGGIFNLASPSITAEQRAVLLHLVSEDSAIGTGKEIRLYLNGILFSTTAIGNVIAPNTGRWILGGDKILADEFYDGLMDETALFNSALTDSQIAAHGAAFLGLATDPFLGFFPASAEVVIGTSGTLNIMVSSAATGATLDGVPIDISGGAGVYPVTVNPTETTTYDLVVTGPGGPFSQSTQIAVVAPPSPPEITSLTVTPTANPAAPNVLLEFTGTPLTSYLIEGSNTLTGTFTTIVPDVGTDATGAGSTVFIGFGTTEFYRVRTP